MLVQQNSPLQTQQARQEFDEDFIIQYTIIIHPIYYLFQSDNSAAFFGLSGLSFSFSMKNDPEWILTRWNESKIKLPNTRATIPANSKIEGKLPNLSPYMVPVNMKIIPR